MVHTSGNGIGILDGAGIYFRDSNYVMSGSKNVSCHTCTSQGDQRGILAKDSIDLQLISTSVHEPVNEPAIEIDNTGSPFSGLVIIDDMSDSNSSAHSVILNNVDAEISGLDISGDGGGLLWKARGSEASKISNSVIWDSESSCLDLVSHTNLSANDISLMCHQSLPT